MQATDGAPAVALAVEQTDPGMMEQGPRDKKEELIEHVMLTGIVIQTFVLTSSCLMVYIIGLYWNTGTWNGSSDGYEIAVYAQLLRKAQTMTIIFILFAELLRAHTCRSLRVSLWNMGLFSNPYMHAAVGVAVSATLMLALVPWFQGVFGLETLQGREWYVMNSPRFHLHTSFHSTLVYRCLAASGAWSWAWRSCRPSSMK